MSLVDDFRTLATDLFATFEAVPVTVEHTTNMQSRDDEMAGRPGTVTKTTATGTGFRGARKVRNAQGVDVQETFARIDIPARTGDLLTIGTRTYEVAAVEEMNPTGAALAITYIAILK